ncbi:hypothetical protein MED297_07331 [Reinekea sp. MED297]|uniref:Uncharacterized protein n=1 Tax=Reinekea blandensis MED297 TaxID=314283 RepID=A4BIF7_9GAMM|nr:hypothetical protein MED297_07331 [Reinekea sp. MED297] [Reinekea blandensis MED297]
MALFAKSITDFLIITPSYACELTCVEIADENDYSKVDLSHLCELWKIRVKYWSKNSQYKQFRFNVLLIKFINAFGNLLKSKPHEPLRNPLKPSVLAGFFPVSVVGRRSF